MRLLYAINARQLLDDRKRGGLPDGPVSVVLDGQTQPAPAIYVRDDMPVDRLDWRMLVNLDVWLWASPTVPFDRLSRTARCIAAVRPHRLTVRFSQGDEVHDVDVGHGLHTPGIGDVPPIHEFTWIPMDLSLTPLGKRLCKALATEIPKWSPM